MQDKRGERERRDSLHSRIRQASTAKIIKTTKTCKLRFNQPTRCYDARPSLLLAAHAAAQSPRPARRAAARPPCRRCSVRCRPPPASPQSTISCRPSAPQGSWRSSTWTRFQSSRTTRYIRHRRCELLHISCGNDAHSARQLAPASLTNLKTRDPFNTWTFIRTRLAGCRRVHRARLLRQGAEREPHGCSLVQRQRCRDNGLGARDRAPRKHGRKLPPSHDQEGRSMDASGLSARVVWCGACALASSPHSLSPSPFILCLVSTRT